MARPRAYVNGRLYRSGRGMVQVVTRWGLWQPYRRAATGMSDAEVTARVQAARATAVAKRRPR